MNTREKHELILKYFDRDISPEEFEELQQLMRHDSETKSIYYEQVFLEHTLDDCFGEQVLSPTAHKVRPVNKSLYRRNIKIAGVAAAACLLLGLMIANYLRAPEPEKMAELRFSQDSVWYLADEVGQGASESGQLPLGAELLIESGAVELRLAGGVIAIVEAPAKLEMKTANEMYLSHGRGSFTVPPEGVGFTVLTPRVRVVDLGTKFGVVSGWESDDQVHVIEGSVELSSGASSRVMRAGSAVSVTGQGEYSEISCCEALFHRELPESVSVLVDDDFEIANLADGEKLRAVPLGWQRFGDRSSGYVGYLNPTADGKFYQQSELKDSSSRGGTVTGMRGVCIGYFYGIRDGGIERKVGPLLANQMYTVTIHLGVRENQAHYGGYAVSLMAGDTVLQSVSGIEPPCEPGHFKALTMTWSSEELSEHMTEGPPLTVRIGPFPQKVGRVGYMDFDNLMVTVAPKGK